MTPDELAKATGARIDRAQTFQPLIDSLAPEYGITTQERMAAFLAQIGHESGGLRWLVEIWGPTNAQHRYEGRSDLGNTEPGDGYRYRGRGLIQITGRANYKDVSEALGMDFISYPDELSEPEWAVRSAMWYWQSHDCNELADYLLFEAITRKINGGLNGYPERLGLWERAKEALA